MIKYTNYNRNRLIFIYAVIIFVLFIIINNFHYTIIKKKVGKILTPLIKITDAEMRSIPPEKLIIFHETSSHLTTEGNIIVSPRQACSIESAARLNPDFIVFLLYTIPSELSDTVLFENRAGSPLKNLYAYNNFRVRILDIKSYTYNTPLEHWYESGELERSNFRVSHTSDILRFLSLWKYGGLYLDLDVITLKTYKTLGMNFMATEADNELASSVLNFDRFGIGYQVAEMCLMELVTDFRGDIWAYNGPMLLTRVFHKICNNENLTDITAKQCQGFSILPTSTFYPVYWTDWEKYFNPDAIEEVINLAKDSYGVHVWNKMSGDLSIDKNTDVAYTVFAKQFCPMVYNENKEIL